MPTASRTTTWLLLATILAGAGVSGCQADYAADLTNRTPQPIFAQMFRKGGSAGGMLGTSRRLGPGDRVFVGPIRTDKRHGAFLSIDSLGNPGRPITLDLQPGTVFLEVQQDGTGPDAPLRIFEKK